MPTKVWRWRMGGSTTVDDLMDIKGQVTGEELGRVERELEAMERHGILLDRGLQYYMVEAVSPAGDWNHYLVPAYTGVDAVAAVKALLGDGWEYSLVERAPAAGGRGLVLRYVNGVNVKGEGP